MFVIAQFILFYFILFLKLTFVSRWLKETCNGRARDRATVTVDQAPSYGQKPLAIR